MREIIFKAKKIMENGWKACLDTISTEILQS